MTEKLRVQVGDVIRQGTGDYSTTVLIAWGYRHHPDEDPPGEAICLVPPVGEGQLTGTAMQGHFMTYMGWLRPTVIEQDAADTAEDDYAAREGHTWEVNIAGYTHVRSPWWETFREMTRAVGLT